MGSDAFVEHLRPLLRDMPLDPNVLHREHDAARLSVEDLFSAMPDKVTRGKFICRATRVYHHELQEVGDHLGLHFSTISVIAHRLAEANHNSNMTACLSFLH